MILPFLIIGTTIKFRNALEQSGMGDKLKRDRLLAFGEQETHRQNVKIEIP